MPDILGRFICSLPDPKMEKLRWGALCAAHSSSVIYIFNSGCLSPTQPQAALIHETKLPNGLNPPKNCGAATANCCCCWTTSAELERAYYLQVAAGVSPLGLSTVSPHPPNLNLKFGLKGLTPSRKSGSSQFGWARLNRKQYQDMLFWEARNW